MANNQYIVGGVMTFLLGIACFYYYTTRRRRVPLKKNTTASSMDDQFLLTGTDQIGGDADIIIVGAGVAGSALAYALAKDGRRVHVIERDLKEPDRIAGEVLLPGGYLKLCELGMEDCVDEIDAQKMLGYVMYKDGKSADVCFPLEKFESHVYGRTLRNGRFVKRLRDKAASLPKVNLEQGTVTGLVEENGTIKGVRYTNKTSSQQLTAYAPLTIVCDGGFSNLRRSLCYSKVDKPSSFVGFILENCKLPDANFGAFIVADPSPIILYPISSTELRCMVDVPTPKLPSLSNGEMAHFLKTTLAPQIPPEFAIAFMSAIENRNNIKVMSTRTMAAAPRPTPGALLMGDAFNMRHPITGGGMTVALADVVLLRDLLRPLHNLYDAPAICKYLESFYTLRKPTASTINTLANTLHKVFSASSDPAMQEMQQACFGYLSLGGIFSKGLSALLSGLCPRPLSLAFHLLAMSVYGVGRLLLPFPSPKRMWNGAKFIWVASAVLFPIIKSEGVTQTFLPLVVPPYYRVPPH